MLAALLVPSVRPKALLFGAPVLGFVGGTQQLTLRQYAINGGYSDAGTGIVWSSSNPAVASVNSAGLVTLLGIGSATISAAVNGNVYTAPVTSVAAIAWTSDWSPLVTRTDLAQPTAFVPRAGGGDGYEDGWPRHVGCGTLGTSRVIFPKSADEWGGYAQIDSVMADSLTPDSKFGTVTKLAGQGPYDDTTAWQVDATTASLHRLKMNAVYRNATAMDNQDVSSWKRGMAVAVKAKTAGDAGKGLRLALSDGTLIGDSMLVTTLLKFRDVVLTAGWQSYYIEFDNYAQFSAYSDIQLVLGTLTDNTSYLYASYTSWNWHAHEASDASNWLRPMPWHESLGLLSQTQTQNSWGPDCDNPVLYNGATSSATAVAAPDSNRYYGGRVLRQFTLGNGQGITTDQAYRVEQATDVYPTNLPTGGAWLHWYIEPGIGALPADGALKAYLTPVPTTDDFTRADSTTTLGSPWVALAGTFGINTNAAYLVTPAGSGNSIAYRETSRANLTVTCTLTAAPANDFGGLGVAFRVVDATNYNLVYAGSGTTCDVYTVVGGSFTNIASGGHTWAIGDVVDVILSGTSIIVKVNGATVVTTSSSANQTATKHGLFCSGTPNSTARWDNFRASGADIGPVSLVRDAYTSLRRSNGGAFYRARIKINQASEGYLDFTPRIVNESGSTLTFNAYRAAMTAEGQRMYGWHHCMVPKRTVTGPVYNDAAWEQIPRLVVDVSVEEGIWIGRYLLPYGLTDLCNLNGNATDADQSNRFSPCLGQSGSFGGADASFNIDVNVATGNTGVNLIASMARGSPVVTGDYNNWIAAINNILVNPTSFPPMVPFDIALAWKNHAIVAFGIGTGVGSSITWLNNGDTFLGGSVALSSNNGLTWALDVTGDSHWGVGSDRDVTRETAGWTMGLAMARTGSVVAATVKGSIEVQIASRFGPRKDYR